MASTPCQSRCTNLHSRSSHPDNRAPSTSAFVDSDHQSGRCAQAMQRYLQLAGQAHKYGLTAIWSCGLFDFSASAHAARQAIGWVRVNIWTECMRGNLPFGSLTDCQHMLWWYDPRLFPLVNSLHGQATELGNVPDLEFPFCDDLDLHGKY